MTELVVYCGLLGLFAVIFLINLPSRDNASLENLAESAEGGALVLSRIHRDLSNTNLGYVNIAPKNDGVAFPTPTDAEHDEYSYDSSGTLLWRTWTAYRLEGKMLNQWEYPAKKTTALASFEAFPGWESKSGRRIGVAASDVVEFRVQRQSSSLEFTVTLDVKGERLQYVSILHTRN